MKMKDKKMKNEKTKKQKEPSFEKTIKVNLGLKKEKLKELKKQLEAKISLQKFLHKKSNFYFSQNKLSLLQKYSNKLKSR